MLVWGSFAMDLVFWMCLAVFPGSFAFVGLGWFGDLVVVGVYGCW